MSRASKISKPLIPAGIAYITLGLVVSLHIAARYAHLHQAPGGFTFASALEIHALVFTTVLLLMTGALCTLVGYSLRWYLNRH